MLSAQPFISEINDLVSAGLLLKAKDRIQEYLGSDSIHREVGIFLNARNFLFNGQFTEGKEWLIARIPELKDPYFKAMSLLVLSEIEIEKGQNDQAYFWLKQVEKLKSKTFDDNFQATYFRVQFRILMRTKNISEVRQLLKSYTLSLVRSFPSLRIFSTYLSISNEMNRLERKLDYSAVLAAGTLADTLSDNVEKEIELIHRSLLERNKNGGTLALVNLKLGLTNRYFQETQGRNDQEVSTTGAELKNYFFEGEIPKELKANNFQFALPNFILVKSLSHVVNIQTKTISSLRNKEMIMELISILATGPITREEIFKMLWPEKTYNHPENDYLLRNLMSRVRREIGLEMRCRKGRLMLNDSVIVLE